jgi:23S rRNA pseudouridine2605 synthase
VLGAPDEHDLERLRRGILIDERRTAPATVALVHQGRGKRAGQTLLSITIREGRNRQVRRMCEAIGHPVESLTRVRIGPIRDPKLPAGRARDLTADEVRRLKAAVAKSPSPSSRGKPLARGSSR